MNYLAHLHIAAHTESNLLGNLLGDFVKGSPELSYPDDIAQGIRLHRHVDHYIDSHPVIGQIKLMFPRELRRFVPIALDLFWDHCLAKQWRSYHSLSLNDFVRQCEKEVKQSELIAELPARYVQLTTKLWSQQWIQSYADFNNTCYAIERIAQQRPRLGGLAECPRWLASHYDELIEQFTPLYQDVLQDAFTYQKPMGCA